MTRPDDPSPRTGAPTAREIAELLARLRGITARGRDVYAGERAQFLADKEALIDGITQHSDMASDEPGDVDPVEAEFDELCERHPRPGDGPGDWVTTRTGTFWHDYDEVDDGTPVSAEIATANPDIWDDQPAPRAVGTVAGHYASTPRVADPEQERREQLARWHADDQSTGHNHEYGAGRDDALTRFTCGPGDEPGGTP